ncbi:MAG: 5'-methylthioadenosine/S-adenosylhomocysteine nucleosidase family protein [Acidimicrobiia bacterium]
MVDGLQRVGVLAPMPSELAPVVKTMGLARDGSSRVHTGRVGSVDVVATRTGMGLALATEATERLLDAEPVDHLVVVGIAGGIGATRVGELVCPEMVVDRASGAAFRASPLAAAAGTISSSDEFVVDPDRVAALVADGVRAVDMETAAVAAVCTDRGVAWSAVRVISDLATDHPDDSVLALAEPDGTPRVWAGLAFMARHPRRVPTLLRIGRDSARAARAAATEAARQLRALA